VFLGKGTAIDLFFFGLLAILLLLPLFQEFEMFGIKLKTEIEDLKRDMNQRFNQIQQSIQTVALSNSVSQQIHFPQFPPQDSALPEMERRLDEILQALRRPDAPPVEPAADLDLRYQRPRSIYSAHV
jgi:hypothetical protein